MQHVRRKTFKPLAVVMKEIREESSRMPRVRLDTSSVFPSRHPVQPEWLTVSQLVNRWQLGRRTIYKFIDSGTLPVWKVGTHLYRIALADVRRFEARNRRVRK